MKKMLKSSLPILMFGVLVLAIIGCGTAKKYVKVPVEVPKVTPKGEGGDYLGKGVVLVSVKVSDRLI